MPDLGTLTSLVEARIHLREALDDAGDISIARLYPDDVDRIEAIVDNIKRALSILGNTAIK